MNKSCKTCEATTDHQHQPPPATPTPAEKSDHATAKPTADNTKACAVDTADGCSPSPPSLELQLKPVKIVKQRDAGCNHNSVPSDDAVRAVHHPLHLSRTNVDNGLEYPEAFGLLPTYLKDMFLAAHFLRGYYQPAGPLITSHMVAGHPSGVSSKSGLDQESLQLLQSNAVAQSQALAGAPESVDAEVLLADRNSRQHTYRYAPGPPPPGPHGPLYARPIHQMHCPTYPPASYYSPYQQHPQDMCYSPPYQTAYYPPKVYPSSYRRYVPTTAYYPTGEVYSAPPPPTTAGSSGVAPPQITASMASMLSAPEQSGHPMAPHMDHYSPAYYTTGYGPGGGQCYSRGMQPPYLDSSSYPSSCPCPMQQSFPKNVHTGPLIGSKTGKGPGQSSHTVAFHDPQTSPLSTASTITTTNTTPPSSASINRSPNRNSQQQQPQSQHTAVASTLSVSPAAATSTTDIPTNGSTSFSTPSSLHHTQIVPCKLELPDDDRIAEQPIVVKPEHTPPVHSYNINSILQQPDEKPTRLCTSLSTTSATMTNSSVLLPEMSISPSRGSAGLQTPPTQDCAVQPAETTVVRRARLGKSMAREMMMISQQQHQHTLGPFSVTTLTQTQPPSTQLNAQLQITRPLPNSAPANHQRSGTCPLELSSSHSVARMSIEDIKREHVKQEADDDVVCLEKDDDQCAIVDLSKEPQEDHSDTEPKFVANKSRPKLNTKKRKYPEPAQTCEIIDVDNSTCSSIPDITSSCTSPVPLCKKPKILELYKSQVKKSPPNSYKSLIKPSAPKPYLCNAEDGTKSAKKSRFRFIRGEPRYGVQHREVLINGKHRKLLVSNGRTAKRRIVKPKSIESKSAPNTAAEAPQEIEVGGEDATKQIENNILETIESPVEICSRIDETQSVLLTTNVENVEPEDVTLVDMPPAKSTFMSSLDQTIDRVATGYFSDQECVAKRRNHKRKQRTARANGGKRSKSENSKKSSSSTTKDVHNSTDVADASTADCAAAKRLAASTEEPLETVVMEASECAVEIQMATTLSADAESHLADDSINNNNNNNNNNIDLDEIIMLGNKFSAPKPNAHKKPRSRAPKFGNRKRHRVKHVQADVEEVLAPRKSNATPRWSNGWSWQGPSFQGKVFLNSDDPQVVRRRYSAMVHDGGDVIRPGDCVLLRAGSKKNELPYVAKVASLWENPEDGEMMMSLLWYYRPEHTEQGRQANDCPDEVFASRHQDHNSVACIEDKCYVLTFNEYCRYRKSVKALEEGLILEPMHDFMAMPQLDRDLPANINSELVLFCRRVYEFRLKRLIKNPT